MSQVLVQERRKLPKGQWYCAHPDCPVILDDIGTRNQKRKYCKQHSDPRSRKVYPHKKYYKTRCAKIENKTTNEKILSFFNFVDNIKTCQVCSKPVTCKWKKNLCNDPVCIAKRKLQRTNDCHRRQREARFE